jgi:hypothetical protein
VLGSAGAATTQFNVAFSRNRFHGGDCKMGGNDITAAAIRWEFADNNEWLLPYASVNGINTAGAGLYRQPSHYRTGFPGGNTWIGASFAANGVSNGTDAGGAVVGSDTYVKWNTESAAFPTASAFGTDDAGAYAGTTFNKVTITAPATAATLALTNNKTNDLGMANSSSAPGAPAGTTSTAAFKMMGLAGAFTPTKTGSAVFTIVGNVANSVNGDATFLALRHGTGTAPANDAALAGSACGGSPRADAAAAGQRVPFTLVCYVTGLTVNTAYWLDVAMEAITGGTSSITNLQIFARELP